ncbi:cyclic pyranopterin monophosphate synthase 1 [bacterium BMS3Bbin09]|nr:cyclic pyranopterin monophosphate synthase 1 [bacterium BMS3Bbin09]
MYSRFARAFIMREMPNYLIAFVTGDCNMNCRFCCNAAQDMRKRNELSPAQWANALKDSRALLHLTVTGGEPFMRDDLDELIIAIAESSGVPDISINTNGFLSSKIYETVEKILLALPNITLTIAVSLDGPLEIHDRLRNKKGSAVAAYKTISSLSMLKDDFPNLKTRLQSIVVPENAGKLDKFIHETNAWPLDFHEIIFPRDCNNKNGYKQSLVDSYRKLAAKQVINYKLTKTSTLKTKIFRLLYKNILRNLDEGYYCAPCPAGGRLIEIFSDGTVVGCEMSKVKGKSEFGTVGSTENTLADLCKTPKAEQFRREIAANCSCTFECAQICNIVFNAKNWIELVKPN